MELFAYIFAWVFAAIVVGLFAGLVIGRMTSHAKRPESEQQKLALRTLLELMPQVASLSSAVEGRNSEIREVHRHVGDLNTSGDLEESRRALLCQIAHLLESNHKLTEDLDFAHLRLEERTEELDRTRREARTDALSGLANRKAFDQRLRMLLGLWKRERVPFVLVLADVDHLKWINDTHGHVAGDRVIQQLGKLLADHVRDGDFVSRYGGDEFAILMPRTEIPMGIEIAERIRVEAARTNFGLGIRGAKAAVTFSCGVAASQEGDTPESLIHRTDEALYLSKHSGRNRVQCQPEATRETALGEILAGV